MGEKMGKQGNRLVATILFVIVGVAGFTAPSFAGNWWENVKVNGDFRYRHEMINKEGKDARQRHRIRARVGIFAKTNEKINIGIQLATGSDDPVSTNQTLDDAFTTKNIGLDFAYFEYKSSIIDGLKIKGGKIKNPFFKPGKSELIWDSDLNPEGGAVTYNHKADNFDLTLIGSGFWIDESSSGDDISLLAGQGGIKLHFNENKSSVVIGGSYFIYNNIKNHAALYEADDPKGNSSETNADDEEIYLNGYELIELFLEVNHKFDQTPVTVMFDHVTNSAADSLKNGWLIGLRVGKAKNPGSWAFRYNYREVEKDAVVGAFSDSDFRGGGTDASGHEFGGAYMVAKNTAFGLTYFANKIGLDADEDSFGRLQADLQLKF